MNATRTWTLKLTPPGEPARVVTVPHDEMIRILHGLWEGDLPAAADRTVGEVPRAA